MRLILARDGLITLLLSMTRISLLRTPGFTLLVLFALSVDQVSGQNDPDFNATVHRRAFGGSGPRVLIDEAHNNVFTVAEGRGGALIKLLTNDGYRVSTNPERFRREMLADYDVLVIAVAGGADPRLLTPNPDSATMRALRTSAFSPDEVEAVHDWVKSGGSLLLVTEHDPYARAMAPLARRLGVVINDGYLAEAWS